MAHLCENTINTILEINKKVIELNNIKHDNITTIDDFVLEYEKMFNIIRELYYFVQNINNIYFEAKNFYDSSEFFSNKYVNMFFTMTTTSLQTELRNTIAATQIKTFEIWNTYLIKIPEISFDQKIRIDLARLKHIKRVICNIFVPIMNQHEKIIKAIKDSSELIDKKSGLYM